MRRLRQVCGPSTQPVQASQDEIIFFEYKPHWGSRFVEKCKEYLLPSALSYSTSEHAARDQTLKRRKHQSFNMSKELLYVPPPGVLGAEGYVHIPIRVADYLNDPGYHPSLGQKLRNKALSSQDQKPQWVSMSRDDYIAYWAINEDGKLLPDVRDPVQGRVEWLRHQLRLNEHWRISGQMKALASSPQVALYW